MSIARKCNRCGAYNDRRTCVIDVVDYADYFNPEDHSYDLCPGCKLEFYEFMEGAKPKNLLERLKERFS